MLNVSSAFAANSADGLDHWIRRGVWHIAPPPAINPQNATTQNLLLERTHVGDRWEPGGDNVQDDWEIQWIPRLFNDYFGTGKFILSIFTHGPGISEVNYEFFKARMNFLHNYADSTNNTLVGADNIWVLQYSGDRGILFYQRVHFEISTYWLRGREQAHRNIGHYLPSIGTQI